MGGLCFGGYPLYSEMKNVSRDGLPWSWADPAAAMAGGSGGRVTGMRF
jgi:hypothetical protein